MKWRPFAYHGDRYDLSHLHPFPLTLTQLAKGKHPERVYRFKVHFSIHCFTSSTKVGDSSDLEYSDNRESRTFSFERYQLSFALPNIIRQIDKQCCSHTGKGNFIIVEHVNTQGETVEYEIYFDINRPASRKEPLELYIQSAYVRSGTSKFYRRKTRKIGFFIIAYNRQVGKPIKMPR